MKKEPIAIIGIGCRFPGAKNPTEFWKLLCDGRDAITLVPNHRWNTELESSDETKLPQTEEINPNLGGFLEYIDQFDPQFFGISPREANSIDPQHRLLLEVTWETLEDAGKIPEKLTTTQTGVFIGISSQDYSVSLWGEDNENNPYATTGTNHCMAANRISYLFDWKGPSIAVDTACSSSLVAVHFACQSLWNGESSLAVAGGVNTILSSEVTSNMAKLGFIASDSRCKTFDARADGYVRGEGAGMVLLKPLSLAEADGDSIYAVIRGSAVNQDGRSNGITAPNMQAQEAVLYKAYQQAGVSPGLVKYIEAHGTGTKLGDPIEMKALGKVLSKDRLPEDYCAVGSVKTNIGHLEAAAGIAGLIKVALSLKHQQIPPSLHFKEPNPYIPFNNLPLRVQETLTPWSKKSSPAIAGVSSFGFGGTNSHVVLEESPVSVKTDCMGDKQQLKIKNQKFSDRSHHILTLSAKSEQAQIELAQRYHQYLANNSTASIADICFSANTTRSHFNHRLAILASDKLELTEKLAKISLGKQPYGVFSEKPFKKSKSPKIVFLFTGQGSQYINMARLLYERQPVFHQAVLECEKILKSYLDKSILEVIYPENTQESHNYLINQTTYTQPALFTIEYALTQLWKSWGIEPDVVMGHSVGEYVAATIAGIFSLEDGLKLVAHRGRLMQQVPGVGEMLAVKATLEEVNSLIEEYQDKVSIAAINGPQNIVVSGAAKTISIIRESFESRGIKTKQLQVSHAFHSPLMEPILADFAAVANQITYNQPQIKLVSNITGNFADNSIATAKYWVNHIRQSVKFAQGMETLYQKGYQVFLEIGAKPVLLGMGRQCLPQGVGTWLASLDSGKEDWQQILQSLAELYVRGVKVDWLGFDKDYPRQRLVLPTYPFQRQRYWIEIQDKEFKQVKSSSNKNILDETIHHLEQSNISKEKDKFMVTSTSREISKRLEKITEEVCEIIANELGFEKPSEIDIYNNLLEIGADSLTLMSIVSKLEKNYGINITVRQFFEELSTVDALARYIDKNLSPEWEEEYTFEVPQPKTLSQEEEILSDLASENIESTPIKPEIEGITALERIMQQQLQVMSKQLEILDRKTESAEDIFVSKNGNLSTNFTNEIPQESNHKNYSKKNLEIENKSNLIKSSTKLSQEISNVDLIQLSDTNYLRTPVEIEEQLHSFIPELIEKLDLDSYKEIPKELENLSIDYIVQAFKEMGWSYQLKDNFSTSEAAQNLHVVNSQQRLFQRLLHILAEVGILQSTKQEWVVLQTLEGANTLEKSQKLLSQYPNAQVELTLLHRCASQLSGVLQGRLNPLQLVFPEGDLTTATQLYQESPPARVINNLIQKVITTALDKLSLNRSVRFLEIGAGTGGTTSYILPHLNPNQTEYTFTDIGGFFNARAKEKFRDYSNVSYQILDIEKNPINQGFKSYSFDVIIAANVLHATTSLHQTLSHVKQLLAPGGILILWESTVSQAWLDLIFGLLGGWQKFSDCELRPDSPLLSKSKWKHLLRETGFAEVVILPNDKEIPEVLSHEAVIIAKADSNHIKQEADVKPALNKQQQDYLDKFITEYTNKTKKSQQSAGASRRVLADRRTVAGFRMELKDMKYPIIADSSHNSKILDIDGNEYIDISMGFGVHLFGHQPQFITEALQNQLEQGMQIGPQAKLAGEVAQLVHELTGMERVAFSNSGTEAVMAALRLARFATKRNKIVIFSGAYHGQFDGVLAVPSTNSFDENLKATPMFPGVLQNMVDDVLVLTYGTTKSLNMIKTHAHELAAVIVEPVQSRRPDLQPKEFLQQLREITKQGGISLIFDEIVTGFRIHPGGAQAWFGIEADIVTYGKCLAGGMPIGVIAGKALYMDGIDGGQWQYGDDSYPQTKKTFFAGTFNKNPLSMAAAYSVLKHLQSQGAALQENLNQRTSKLITALNAYFEQEDLPIKMFNFGSVFRFVLSGNVSYLFQPIELEILFYHLIQKGIYIWEGRTGFLSTVHTDEDINYIISAVKESISEMRQGGFFPKNNQQIHQTYANDTEWVRGVL